MAIHTVSLTCSVLPLVPDEREQSVPLDFPLEVYSRARFSPLVWTLSGAWAIDCLDSISWLSVCEDGRFYRLTAVEVKAGSSLDWQAWNP